MANLGPKNDLSKWWNLSSFSWFLEKVRKKCKTSEDFAKSEVPHFQKKLAFSPPLRGHCHFLFRCCIWCSAFSNKKVVLQPPIAGALSFCFETLHPFLMSYDGQKNFFRNILPISETERNGNSQKKKKNSAWVNFKLM